MRWLHYGLLGLRCEGHMVTTFMQALLLRAGRAQAPGIYGEKPACKSPACAHDNSPASMPRVGPTLSRCDRSQARSLEVTYIMRSWPYACML